MRSQNIKRLKSIINQFEAQYSGRQMPPNIQSLLKKMEDRLLEAMKEEDPGQKRFEDYY